MTSLRAGRAPSLGPVRPPWFNIPAEARTRSAGEGEPLEGEETYPTPDYPTEPYDVVPDQEPATVDPVDVVIVGGIPAPLTDWSSQTYTVEDVPIMVAGRNKNRQRLVIRSDSANSELVSIMRMATDLPQMSYKLDVGEQLEMLHNEQVWVVGVAGTPSNVNVMTEFVVESGE